MPSGPSTLTVKRLFAVSGNRCAFPGYDATLVDLDTGIVNSEICHIRARRQLGGCLSHAPSGCILTA